MVEIPQEIYKYDYVYNIDSEGNESYNTHQLQVKNQKKTKKCVAYSISSLMELQHKNKTGYLIEQDENYIWVNGVRGDKGMYLRKTLRKLGFDFYTTNSNSFIKEAIVKKYVIIDIKTDKIFKRNKTGIIKQHSKKTTGNHAMLITGYAYIKGKLHWKVQNSWGKKWGNNGYCYLPCNYPNINNIYIVED